MTRCSEPIELALQSLKNYKNNYVTMNVETCDVLINAVENEIERTVKNTGLSLEQMLSKSYVYYVQHGLGYTTGTWYSNSEITSYTIQRICNMQMEGTFYEYVPYYKWVGDGK